jgi:hypothetical protein
LAAASKNLNQPYNKDCNRYVENCKHFLHRCVENYHLRSNEGNDRIGLPVLSRYVKFAAMAKKGSKKMLSVKEAASKIGAAGSSVRYWLTKGRFPNAELVQPDYGVPYWLIPESDLDGFEIGKPGPKPGTKKPSTKASEKKGSKK